MLGGGNVPGAAPKEDAGPDDAAPEEEDPGPARLAARAAAFGTNLTSGAAWTGAFAGEVGGGVVVGRMGPGPATSVFVLGRGFEATCPLPLDGAGKVLNFGMRGASCGGPKSCLPMPRSGWLMAGRVSGGGATAAACGAAAGGDAAGGPAQKSCLPVPGSGWLVASGAAAACGAAAGGDAAGGPAGAAAAGSGSFNGGVLGSGVPGLSTGTNGCNPVGGSGPGGNAIAFTGAGGASQGGMYFWLPPSLPLFSRCAWTAPPFSGTKVASCDLCLHQIAMS